MTVNEIIARVRVEWGAVKDQWNLRPKAASLGWEHLLKKKNSSARDQVMLVPSKLHLNRPQASKQGLLQSAWPMLFVGLLCTVNFIASVIKRSFAPYSTPSELWLIDIAIELLIRC